MKVRRISSAVVAAALVLSGCGSTANDGEAKNIVKVLWWGQYQDGRVARGITPVLITVAKHPDSDFTVNLDGLTQAGTGEVWNASAWSGASVATLVAGRDPRGLSVAYSVSEKIDGPSAGALMAAGTMANLFGTTVAQNTSMTGTILPNGGIGPVGGIPDKIRAAKKAGLTKVLIPTGQRFDVDPSTGKNVDVIAQGKDLGIEVVEIDSVEAAYAQIVGGREATATADPGPVAASLLSYLAAEARSINKDLPREIATVAPANTPDLRVQRATVVAAATSAQRTAAQALAADESIEAFGVASVAERSIKIFNAQASTQARLTESNAAVVTSGLIATAARYSQAANSRLTAASQTQTSYLEQLVALPDALSWSTDALAQIRAAHGQLSGGSVRSATLPEIAGRLAEANYDSAVLMPIAIHALTLTGGKKISKVAESNDLLVAYAKFLAQAAHANATYYAATIKADNPTAQGQGSDAEVAALADRWTEASVALPTGGPQAVVALSTAISYFVASTALVAGLGTVAVAASGTAATPRVSIVDHKNFKIQTELASRTTEAEAAELAAKRLDSSYLRWGDQWGSVLATAPDSAQAPDGLRREGLVYQWYSNLQGRMLSVFERSNG
jgi:hypothetical protein